MSSCAPIKVHIDDVGYVIGQDNYAFAIYTGDGNLLTHPIQQFRQRQKSQTDRPFSDVYIISHAWNFTIPEAIGNYHSYIEIINHKMKTISFGPDFRPFFIFLVWNSVTRPMTDAMKAILPYELDASLGPLTATADKFVFFLPSVWKQSINASTIGLGQDLPEEYRTRQLAAEGRGKDNSECAEDDQEVSCYGIEEKSMGYQYPVSGLLHDLFLEKEKSPQPLSIHVIGHSFGAKIAALSSMEAIRQWRLEQSPDGNSKTPLDSLLLISPAMNPREFSYIVDFPALHFFIPLDRLVRPGQPADQLDLFRPTKPALGRTGLNKAGKGRSKWWNVAPVENFVDDTTDVKPDTFCALSSTTYSKSSGLPTDIDAPVLKHTRIYSFDASTVFDGGRLGRFFPSGSHGDVGSHDLVNCNPLSTEPSIQKREHSANFIFNFTKVLPLSNETTFKP